MKKIIAVLMIIVLLLVTVTTNFKNFRTQPSNDIFTALITEENPFMVDGNKPVFTIDSISRHKNWYIVTIKSTKLADDFIPVYVIFEEEGLLQSSLNIRLGPETQFSSNQLLGTEMPEPVLKELPKV